jgi:hypothetical protein
MALFALDIPAPERPEVFIEQSCSRARHNEVRPHVLLCKAFGPAAALLLLLQAAALTYHRGDSMLFSTEASAAIAPLQLRLATTDPLFGEGHHSNGGFQMIAFNKMVYLTKSQAFVIYTTIPLLFL